MDNLYFEISLAVLAALVVSMAGKINLKQVFLAVNTAYSGDYQQAVLVMKIFAFGLLLLSFTAFLQTKSLEQTLPTWVVTISMVWSLGALILGTRPRLFVIILGLSLMVAVSGAILQW